MVEYPLKFPTSSKSENLWREQRWLCENSMYYLGSVVMGRSKMVQRLHLPFCNFMQLFPWTGGPLNSRRKMGWMGREHFKSTVVSEILPLHLLIHNQQDTIALISAVEDNTKKWLRTIKQTIEGNPYFRWLYPEIRPKKSKGRYTKWDETEIIIERDEGVRTIAQASVTASSIKSGQASQHYRHIILDDPVNEKIAASETELAHVIDLYKYLESLLQGWGESTFTMVGTPYGRGDVIEYAMEHDVKNGERLYWGIGARGDFQISPELEGRKDLIPLTNPEDYPGTDPFDERFNVEGPWEEGKPIFPEECPESKLVHLEKQDPELCWLQYYCKPYDLARNGFQLDKIEDFLFHTDGRLTCECHPHHDHNIANGITVVLHDPAATEDKKNCEAAGGALNFQPCSCKFILEEWGHHILMDEAILKLHATVNRWARWTLGLGIETIGYQLAMKQWIEEKQTVGEFPQVQVFDLKPKNRNKDTRIKSQMAAVNSGHWHKRKSMKMADGNFMHQLSLWPYGKLRDRIDLLFGYANDVLEEFELRAVSGPEYDDDDFDVNLQRRLWEEHQIQESLED
jgi:hypothetical protein